MEKSLAITLNNSRFTRGLLILLAVMGISACDSQKNTSTATTSETSSVDTPIVITPVTAKDLTPYAQRPIEDEVFYFVLPDRFYNGDPANDQGSLTHAISSGGFDPRNEMSYHGGDLVGLVQKLPYLEQLGVSAIWLTPILRNQAVQGDNSGYHGYWVLDFTEIDPHLGSNDDLKQLIAQAHQRNIKIFFDIIVNHTADVIKYTECHGEDGSGWSEGGEACPYISLAEIAQGKQYHTVIQAGNEQLKTPAWLNDAKYYHNQGDSTFEGENSLNGDFFGLDDLNTELPEVVTGMIDIYKNIIDEFKPDGFRIDTVKHVNIEFWQQFAPALQQHAKQQGINNFFMFGEVYSGNPVELSKFTTQGKLPSVLDFGLQSVLYKTLIEQQGTNKFAELFAQDTLFPDANQLMNFTGNHDMGRFGYLLRQTGTFTEQEVAQRLKLATAISFFVRGIPIIYYGDEQGFVGTGNNHKARQDMMPSQVSNDIQVPLLLSAATSADDNFNSEHPLYTYIAELASVYHQTPTLRYGKQNIIFSNEQAGLLIIKKQDAHGEYLVAFNTSSDSKTTSLSLDKSYNLVYQSNTQAAAKLANNSALSLAGLSVAIYQAN